MPVSLAHHASVLAVLLIGAVQTDAPAPPVAEVHPHRLEAHGDVRLDEYHWLRERENPAVIGYLEAENAYLEQVLAPVADLRQRLYDEIVARLDPTDASVPYLLNGYDYYERHVPGGDYALKCRRRAAPDAPEEVMLDGNALAAGHAFFSLRGPVVSADNRIAAYAVDTVGRRKYTVRFRDLDTGADLPDAIDDVTGNLVWAEGPHVLFYARQDPQTLRAFQIWRHTLGEDPARDAMVYQEDDPTFSVRVGKSKSRQYLLIVSSQTMSDEVRFLRADDPLGEWDVFQPRERGLEYAVDHAGDRFLVRTNWEAENFRLMAARPGSTGREHWQVIVPHRADVLLDGFEIFRRHLVLRERRDGLPRLRIVAGDGSGETEVPFDDPTYAVFTTDNHDEDAPVLRYAYTSLTTPQTIYDHDLETGERTLRKQERVLGGFDPGAYRSEYLHATAADGTRVPISLVYRADLFEPGSNPLLLYGYGSYGSSSYAAFSSPRLSLLDRGFVYAIAHVRGGQEMGRRWYDDGRLLRKQNTFTDFIACGRHLVEEGYADPDRLYCAGGSAGGLLVGAVLNLAPDLFDGAVAWVPFVDVVTTMLDDSIPLTTGEYDEWGDPHDPESYRYMLGYSPYDNVAAQPYPHLLVTTGLHDSQVQYWEPAKWVARLRARKTDDNRLLLQTNMEAGHGGASGRFKQHRETALAWAFLLDCAGLAR
ncbi:MAG: S9 family peptidase [Candidatus Krumholzibacteriia bacterium]